MAESTDIERLREILKRARGDTALPWRKKCHVICQEALELIEVDDWSSALVRAASAKAKEQINLRASGIYTEFCEELRAIHNKGGHIVKSVPVQAPVKRAAEAPSPKREEKRERVERVAPPEREPGERKSRSTKRARFLTEEEREQFSLRISRLGGSTLSRLTGVDAGLLYNAAKGRKDIVPERIRAVLKVDPDAVETQHKHDAKLAKEAKEKARLIELIRTIVREELAALKVTPP